MKRFNLSKMILSFVLLLVAVFTLAACGGETDQEKLDAVVGNIEVFYGTGETATTVESDLTLPTTVGEYQISWTSSNTDVISNAGVVTQPTADTQVTLTATITLNEASAEATFTVTVLAGYFPADVLANIEITGDNLTAPDQTNDFYITTGDIVLPTTDGDYAITWTSGNTAVIANDGTVTRPLKDAGNAMVILTATVGTETAQFAVQVPELADYTDTQKLDFAYPALLVSGVDAGVVTGQEIGLATEVGTNGVTVTWESSAPTVIYTDGRVVRPEMGNPDVNVTVTATLHSGDMTRTKAFEFVVKARTVAAEASGTITAMFAEAMGTYVRFNDVTILGTSDDGMFVQDASGTAFVYGGTLGTKYAVGDVVNIEGFVANYYGALQLSGTADDPIYMVPSTGTATAPTYENSTVGAINALDLPNASTNLFNVMAVHIEAVVTIVGEGNYSVFLVPADHIGDFDSHDAIMIYYKSNIEAVQAMAGKKVALDLLVIGYRTDKVVWYADFVGSAEDITEVALTDSESVTIANAGLGANFEKEYVENATLDLPTDINGVTVAWSTQSSLVDTATGALTMPASGNEQVTLNATLTKGDVTQNFTVTFQAGEIAQQDVSAALAVENGYYVHVVGEVTASQYYRTFFVQDATGGIAIYTGSDADLIAFLTTNLNKEVDIVGLRAAYNGLNQISGVALYSAVGDPTTPVVAADVTSAGLDADALAMYQGQLVTFNGLVVTGNSTDSYDNVYITLFDTTTLNEVTMKWDSRVDLTTAQLELLNGLAVGDTVNVTTPLAWNNGPYLYFTDSTVVSVQTKTDAEMLALAISLLENVAFDAQYYEATTLDLPATIVGATVTYASDSPYLDEATGELTLPDFYRADVAVTASVTYGAESGTANIAFVVGPMSIEDARMMTEGDTVTVQGLVTAENNGVFYIQDDTAGIAVYNYYTATDDIAFFHDNLGNIVEVTGDLAVASSGLLQLENLTYSVVSTTATAVTPMDISALDWADSAAMLPYQGTWASLDQMVIVNIYTSSSTNMSIYLERSSDGAAFLLYYNHYDTLSTEQQAVLSGLAVGEAVNVEAVVGWYNGAQFLFTEQAVVTEVALTDADKVYLDADAISIVSTATEAGTLTLPAAGSNGTAITWESSNTAIISNAGEVVLPAETTDVTMTATVTLGTESLQVQFVVTVVAPSTVNTTELFISEYMEGGGYNKAVEIFNGTGSSVDLSVYSVALYSAASATISNELALVGSLADGDVYVVSRSDAAAEIVAVTDLTDTSKTTINWNGDDAVALLKNGVIIDIVGANDGTDPGTAWTWTAAGGDGATGSTQDRTLVRKAGTLSPSATFDTAQWDVYAKDTLTYIGSHVA